MESFSFFGHIRHRLYDGPVADTGLKEDEWIIESWIPGEDYQDLKPFFLNAFNPFAILLFLPTSHSTNQKFKIYNT
jgi:hypothetical protein